MAININNNPKFFERSKCLVRDGASVEIHDEYGNDTSENMLSYNRYSQFTSDGASGVSVEITITLPSDQEINRIFLLNHNFYTFQISYRLDEGGWTGFENWYSSKLTCDAANTVNSTGTTVKSSAGITGVYPDETQEGQLIKQRYYWFTALDAETLKAEWSWSEGGHRTTVGNFTVVQNDDTSITGTGLKITGGADAIDMTANDIAYCLPTRPVTTGPATISETDNTRSNSYFEFDTVTADQIRISVDATFPLDSEEKIIEQVIVTKELDNSPLDFPCMAMPIDVSKNNKVFQPFQTSRIDNRKGYEHFIVKLDYTQAMNPSNNDLELFDELEDSNASFLIWPCGGFENHRIRAIKGHRPQDVFNVNTVEDTKTYEFYKNLYNSGAVTYTILEESK